MGRWEGSNACQTHARRALARENRPLPAPTPPPPPPPPLPRHLSPARHLAITPRHCPCPPSSLPLSTPQPRTHTHTRTHTTTTTAIDVAWGLPSLAGKAAWEPLSADVGDKIRFKWAGGLSYGLYQVSSGVCMASEEVYESTPGAVIKEVREKREERERGERERERERGERGGKRARAPPPIPTHQARGTCAGAQPPHSPPFLSSKHAPPPPSRSFPPLVRPPTPPRPSSTPSRPRSRASTTLWTRTRARRAPSWRSWSAKTTTTTTATTTAPGESQRSPPET